MLVSLLQPTQVRIWPEAIFCTSPPVCLHCQTKHGETNKNQNKAGTSHFIFIQRSRTAVTMVQIWNFQTLRIQGDKTHRLWCSSYYTPYSIISGLSLLIHINFVKILLCPSWYWHFETEVMKKQNDNSILIKRFKMSLKLNVGKCCHCTINHCVSRISGRVKRKLQNKRGENTCNKNATIKKAKAVARV